MITKIDFLNSIENEDIQVILYDEILSIKDNELLDNFHVYFINDILNIDVFKTKYHLGKIIINIDKEMFYVYSNDKIYIKEQSLSIECLRAVKKIYSIIERLETKQVF